MLIKTPISVLKYADNAIQAYTPVHSLAEISGAISRTHNNLLFVTITTSTEEGQSDPVLFTAIATPIGVLIRHPDASEPSFKLIEEDGVLMLESEIEG